LRHARPRRRLKHLPESTTGDGPVALGDEEPTVLLADVPAPRPVLESELVHRGMVWDLRRDTVDLGAEGTVRREYLDHPGAVAVMVLDDDERVFLLRQYRHPVRRELWEPPAGLRDAPGEDPLDTAARELAEEADLRAARWDVLLDMFTSPGGSSESIRVYLARSLSEVPADERYGRTAEEAEMRGRWWSLDEACDAVMTGRIASPTAVSGLLALDRARRAGWVSLRPAGG